MVRTIQTIDIPDDKIRTLIETKKEAIYYAEHFRRIINPNGYDVCVCMLLCDKTTKKVYYIEKSIGSSKPLRGLVENLGKKLLKRPKKYLYEDEI